jgi:hypothetical protein
MCLVPCYMFASIDTCTLLVRGARYSEVNACRALNTSIARDLRRAKIIITYVLGISY